MDSISWKEASEWWRRTPGSRSGTCDGHVWLERVNCQLSGERARCRNTHARISNAPEGRMAWARTRKGTLSIRESAYGPPVPRPSTSGGWVRAASRFAGPGIEPARESISKGNVGMTGRCSRGHSDQSAAKVPPGIGARSLRSERGQRGQVVET
jgi:hypothetical protein